MYSSYPEREQVRTKFKGMRLIIEPDYELKAVGESVSKPLEYYHNNMIGTFRIATC